MTKLYLKQLDLAERWGISPRTLERWRGLGRGPRHVKIGGRVRYRLEDIEAYEARHRQEPPHQSPIAEVMTE